MVEDLSTSFRNLMATVPCPVGVITASFNGEHHGATVTAFCSLSMNPPLLLVALGNTSSTLTTVRQAERFGFNLLAANQEDISNLFATNGADKFSQTDWQLIHQVPVLSQSPAWIACEVSELIDGGDHTIVIGKVVVTEDKNDSRLLYANRSYWQPTKIISD